MDWEVLLHPSDNQKKWGKQTERLNFLFRIFTALPWLLDEEQWSLSTLIPKSMWQTDWYNHTVLTLIPLRIILSTPEVPPNQKETDFPWLPLKLTTVTLPKAKTPGTKFSNQKTEEAGIPNKNDGPTRNTKRYTPLPSVASEFDGLIRLGWGFNSDGSEPAAQGPYYTGAGQREGTYYIFLGWVVCGLDFCLAFGLFVVVPLDV